MGDQPARPLNRAVPKNFKTREQAKPKGV